MYQPFFPELWFAWVFVAVLLGFLLTSTVFDFRTLTIPKWISVPCFGVGFLFNIVRGAWMGYQDAPNQFLPEGGVWMGAADGLVFALLGAAFAFGLFFVMWILGLCKGGDVKLLTGVGAWVGAQNTFFILVVSTFVLCVVYTLVMLVAFLTGGMKAVKHMSSRNVNKIRDPKKVRGRYTSYSFSVALAALVVLLWVFRVDLGLSARPNVGNSLAQVAQPRNV